MTIVQVKVTDFETCKTIETTISANNEKELVEKLDKAFNKCLVEVLDKPNKS